MSTAATPPQPAVTSIGEDYLKAVWSAREWGGAPATTSALAERFGVTAATASDTVRRLAAAGLLVHEPYRSITLTAAGEREALRMVRRHRLVEAFLVTALGYRLDEVHDEAERLEHAVSELMIERIDRMLGHPACDPHGDPIPAADGRIAHPPDAVTLGAAAPGEWRVTRISDADPRVLRVLEQHGLLPGASLTVRAGDALTGVVAFTLADGEAHALGRPAIDAVLLVPA